MSLTLTNKSPSQMLLEEEIEDEPVSPTAQYFNSKDLCVSILAVFESEIPVDDSPALTTLQNLFLPINPRFSSIMVNNEEGEPVWKKVEVRLQDHIQIPSFPQGLEFYDDYMQEYIRKIAAERLPESKPLWNIHIIKYPTRNAAGLVVFKLHHSLGDGFSLMSALFNCLKRADDPSLPLTFPSQNVKSNGGKWKFVKGIGEGLSMLVNTVRDVSWMMRSSGMEDSKSGIRSGDGNVEDNPITLSTVDFSLQDIKMIKNKMNATVNDVITGIIFSGLQVYLQSTTTSPETAKPKKVTALVLLNTRAIKAYQPLKEMTQHGTKAPWGNHFTFLHVSIPTAGNPMQSDPLDAIKRSKKIIKAKRNSFGVYITASILELIRKFRGSEAVSKYILGTFRGTSLAISNLIGPLEKIQIANHPIRRFYFMMVGAPQSLTVTVVSYAGVITVAIGAERDLVDSKLLVNCMENAFKKIFEAAV